MNLGLLFSLRHLRPFAANFIMHCLIEFAAPAAWQN
jgi:hypothetical protein